MLYQVASFRVRTACSDRYVFGILEFPDAVILQPPEGVLGVIASARRPEIYQKLSQLCIHLLVGDEPVFVSPAAGQRVKKKQGFVGCALGTFLPDVDTFDLRFQFSLVHFVSEIRSAQKNKERANGRLDNHIVSYLLMDLPYSMPASHICQLCRPDTHVLSSVPGFEEDMYQEPG